MNKEEFITRMEREWAESERWRGIERPYTAEEVYTLRGSMQCEYTLAKKGAARLWDLVNKEDSSYVAVLSAVNGNQAVQEVKAGLQAIYVSGWQVAADANHAGQMYPDQSLYPSDSVPALVRRINNSLRRADQIHHMKGNYDINWFVPIVADAEAGFGGPLNAAELMREMIECGAAGVHFEDQLSSAKKCGHLGGKVLVPTREFVTKLVAARLAADMCGVDTLLIARTDALAAQLLTSDIDPVDQEFLTGERTREGFFRVRSGIEAAISRARAYAPYADMIWCETSRPDLTEARVFAEAVLRDFPEKKLAYNCSPSFNWRMHLSDNEALKFQKELGAMGYKFQFVTLSGFHALNYITYWLAREYRQRGMAAYADLQQQEFEAEKSGYEAIRHQEFVGTGYFDRVLQAVSDGLASTLAMEGSTEEEQFHTAEQTA
ncbi:MAG: isocitrate lyase [Acidobacteria bacterium]|nr:isocitrate lyase [Acidobacteriota bacterium]